MIGDWKCCGRDEEERRMEGRKEVRGYYSVYHGGRTEAEAVVRARDTVSHGGKQRYILLPQ